MRAVFGVLSLLVALAIVAYVAKAQLKSVPVASGATTATAAPGATVPAEARSIEDKARADVEKELQQGARRTEDADR